MISKIITLLEEVSRGRVYIDGIVVELESAASSSRVKIVEFLAQDCKKLLETRLFSLELEAADSDSTTLPSDTLVA